MQPDLHATLSGVRYRIIVKRYFRRMQRFYLLVSVYESVLCDLFLTFLTDGNKSKCGTLQCLTHPRQSTAEPTLMPTSSPKRQASQRKSCVPSSVSAHSSYPRLLPTCLSFPPTSPSRPPLLPTRLSCPPTSPSHLRTQRTYIPAAPHLRPRRTPDTPPGSPQALPRHTPRHSPDTPPGTPQTFPQAHPRLSPRHSSGTPRALPQALPSQTPGTPQTHPSLPKVARNSSRASFADGLKTPEYQRSNFKT